MAEKFKLQIGDKVEIRVAGTDTDIELVDVQLRMRNGKYFFKSLTKGSNQKEYSAEGANVTRRLN